MPTDNEKTATTTPSTPISAETIEKTLTIMSPTTDETLKAKSFSEKILTIKIIPKSSEIKNSHDSLSSTDSINRAKRPRSETSVNSFIITKSETKTNYTNPNKRLRLSSMPLSLRSHAEHITHMVEMRDDEEASNSTQTMSGGEVVTRMASANERTEGRRRILEDENEFMRKHFRKVVTTYLPKDSGLKVKSSCTVPRWYTARQSRWFEYNCGQCSFVRYFTIVCWVLGLLVYVLDSCTGLVWRDPIPNKTTPITRIGSSSFELITSTTTPVPRYQYCKAKGAFICFILIGLGFYLIFFLLYSQPKLVIYLYRVPWYLVEAITLAVHGVILFVFCLAAFFFAGHNEATGLVLVGTVLSLVLALTAYKRHTGREILPIIVQNDPHMNLIQKLLNRLR